MRIIDERAGSELEEWARDGFRQAPTHSNVVSYGSPDDVFVLSVHLDDPVEGYLLKLALQEGDLLARVIVEDRQLAEAVAHELASRAGQYKGLEADRGESVPVGP